MQYSHTATGEFPTSKARAYMQQLCKHFAHKIPVTCHDDSAQATFPMGPCDMWASDDMLRVTLHAATQQELAQQKTIIDSHLERFAFREGFTTMAWAQ